MTEPRLPGIGVVGSGHWAAEVQLPACLDSDNAALTGVWSEHAAHARAAAQRLGVRAFARFEDLLDASAIVSFCVPPSVQAAGAMRALSLGKALCLEKPMARTEQEATALASLAASVHRRVGVHYTRLLDEGFHAWLANCTAEGALSGSVVLTTGAIRSGSPYAASKWRHEADAPIWDLGPHAVSAVIPVLGLIEAVSAHRESGLIRVRCTHAGRRESTLALSLTADTDRERFAFTDIIGRSSARAGEPRPRSTFTRLVALVAGEEPRTAVEALVLDLSFSTHITRVLEAAVESARRSGAAVSVR